VYLKINLIFKILHCIFSINIAEKIKSIILSKLFLYICVSIVQAGSIEFKKFLNKLHSNWSLSYCFYEEVRKHIGTDAAHIYGGYVATLQAWCIENSIQYSGTPVVTIKKHITGKGNASKEEVILSVKQNCNLFPSDHNEADAIALCDYHLENPQE
jgi:Holliday junction resolvasome RuvABC endonuclease subunit